MIDIEINGRVFKVNCNNLNLPLNYLTDNSNILNE